MPKLENGARNPFGVYRIDPDGSIHRIIATPDDATLYLVESNRAAGGARRIMAYP